MASFILHGFSSKTGVRGTASVPISWNLGFLWLFKGLFFRERDSVLEAKDEAEEVLLEGEDELEQLRQEIGGFCLGCWEINGFCRSALHRSPPREAFYIKFAMGGARRQEMGTGGITRRRSPFGTWPMQERQCFVGHDWSIVQVSRYIFVLLKCPAAFVLAVSLTPVDRSTF